MCPSWVGHTERSNMTGHAASQSPAISRQPPRQVREIAKVFLWLISRLRIIGNSGEIDSKSIPGEAPGLPKSSQNRSRDPLGTPGDTQERSRSVFGASWGVPGVLREHPESLQSGPARPERASGSIRERAEAARINAKSSPGEKKQVFLARLGSEAAS